MPGFCSVDHDENDVSWHCMVVLYCGIRPETKAPYNVLS